MTEFPYLTVLLLVSLLFMSCDDDCMKTITHPGYTLYTPGGSVYYPEQNQEIPCDAAVPEGSELGQNVSYLTDWGWEVLEFNFTPDTGNNTNRLQFKIRLHNDSNTLAQGTPILTLLIDGVESTANFSSQASNPCNEIGANSSCILTYDKETSLDLAIIENIELVDVKYVLRSR